MKNLFTFLAVFLSLSLIITSCGNNDDDVNPSGASSNSSNVVDVYCDEIDVWVLDNYPNETIDSVTLVTDILQGTVIDVYKVYLSNGVIATFNVDEVFGLPACSLIDQTLPCGCPIINDPVCVDGTTYYSECEALCAGEDPNDIEPGACSPCGCDNVWDPVCGDGVDYDNECLAICAGVDPLDIVPGECGDPCDSCAGDPVCVNGIDYANECEALCAGVDPDDIEPGACSSGTCNVEALFPTATVVSEVSGYDEVGYGNAFYAIVLDFGGTEITVYFTETCEYYTFCDCDPDLDIVCGAGTNYINSCHAECDGVDVGDITPGPC